MHCDPASAAQKGGCQWIRKRIEGNEIPIGLSKERLWRGPVRVRHLPYSSLLLSPPIRRDIEENPQIKGEQQRRKGRQGGGAESTRQRHEVRNNVGHSDEAASADNPMPSMAWKVRNDSRTTSCGSTPRSAKRSTNRKRIEGESKQRRRDNRRSMVGVTTRRRNAERASPRNISHA